MAKTLMYYINDSFATRSMADAKNMTMGDTSTFGLYGCNWGLSSDTKPYIYDNSYKDFTGHTETYKSEGVGTSWSKFTPEGISSNNGSEFKWVGGMNVKPSFGSIEIGPSATQVDKNTFTSSLIGPAIQNVVGCSIVWTPQMKSYGTFAKIEKIGLVYAEWTGSQFTRHVLPANTIKSGHYFDDPISSGSGYPEVYTCCQWSTSNQYYKKVTNSTLYWMGVVLTFKNVPSGFNKNDQTACKIRNFRPVVAGRSPPGQVAGKSMLFNRPGGAPLSDIVKGKYCFA